MLRRCGEAVVLLVLSLLWFSACGTSSVTAGFVPDGAYFIPQVLPDLSIPLDVGARSEDPSDESAGLMDAFKEAYAEALIRGLPLMGVLGGDRVNPWPETAAESWSQNWASSGTEPNSWGIPGLILALGDYRASSGTPVYTVYGQVLNQYGKSAGYNGTNGAAGYGIPLGELYFSGGEAVQRFRRGRIIVSREGSRFQFEADTVTPLLESLSEDEINREFGGKNIPPEVSAAFVRAWAFAFADSETETERESDGPVVRINFSKPWVLQTEGEPVSAGGFYIKSYNSGDDVLILVEGQNLPVRVHRLSKPVLSVLLSRERLPGLERERPLGNSGGGSALGKSLAGGFALYGPPLSDALPWPAESEEAPPFLEAQRFSRGWIIVKPAVETETAEPEEYPDPSGLSGGTDEENAVEPVW
jgi:hypothetical protein